jgi:hypothetical protein
MKRATRQSTEIFCQLVVSAGEIDCREGLGGPLLEGYTQSCHEHVVQTVKEYVNALHRDLVADPESPLQQILVMPIADCSAQANVKGTRGGSSGTVRDFACLEQGGAVIVAPLTDRYFCWTKRQTALQLPDQEAYIVNHNLLPTRRTGMPRLHLIWMKPLRLAAVIWISFERLRLIWKKPWQIAV